MDSPFPFDFPLIFATFVRVRSRSVAGFFWRFVWRCWRRSGVARGRLSAHGGSDQFAANGIAKRGPRRQGRAVVWHHRAKRLGGLEVDLECANICSPRYDIAETPCQIWSIG